jgi:bacterioferritin
MKGNAKVIAALNEALQEELLAINQYFLHAEMCENWKYEALAKFIKKQSIDEMKHAEKIIERILFLDGTPSVTGPGQLKVGKNVKEQLANDLELELGAVQLYNRAVKLARDESDNATAEFFQVILKDEEEHVDWLEAQAHLIQDLGYERYLTQQLKKD